MSGQVFYTIGYPNTKNKPDRYQRVTLFQLVQSTLCWKYRFLLTCSLIRNRIRILSISLILILRMNAYTARQLRIAQKKSKSDVIP